MKKEKIFVLDLDHCPHCGMDGTLKFLQAIGKSPILVCLHCKKWVYELKIIKTHFDVNKMEPSWFKSNYPLDAIKSYEKLF